MRAFTSETKISKERLLEVLAEHRKADRIIQGHYWLNGRGCAVGCSIHDFAPGYENGHQMYEDLFGIPEQLAELEDKIFEGLSITAAKKWPERFIRAIQPGADLSVVCDEWLLWLLRNDKSPLAPWKNMEWMANIAALYERRLVGNEPAFNDWNACKEKAWDVSFKGTEIHILAAEAVAEAAIAGMSSWNTPALTSVRLVCYPIMEFSEDHHKHAMAKALVDLLKAAPVKVSKNDN